MKRARRSRLDGRPRAPRTLGLDGRLLDAERLELGLKHAHHRRRNSAVGRARKEVDARARERLERIDVARCTDAAVAAL